MHWTTFYRDGEVAIARGHTYARVCWTWRQTGADIGPATLTFAGVNAHNRWEAVKTKTGVYPYWRRRHCCHTNQPEVWWARLSVSVVSGQGFPTIFSADCTSVRSREGFLTNSFRAAGLMREYASAQTVAARAEARRKARARAVARRWAPYQQATAGPRPEPGTGRSRRRGEIPPLSAQPAATDRAGGS